MNHDLTVRAIHALERIAGALTGAVAKTGHSPVDLQFRAVEALEQIAERFAPMPKADPAAQPTTIPDLPPELQEAVNRARATAGVAPLDPPPAAVPPLDATPGAPPPPSVVVPASPGPVAAPPGRPAYGQTSPMAVNAGNFQPTPQRPAPNSSVGFIAPKPTLERQPSAADLGVILPPTAGGTGAPNAAPSNGAKPQ